EMIERSQWEHAEDCFRPDQSGGYRIDGAVTAAGDDQSTAALNRISRQFRDVLSLRCKDNCGFRIDGFDQGCKIVARFGGRHPSGSSVHDNLDGCVANWLTRKHMP